MTPYATPSAVMLLLLRQVEGRTQILLQHRHGVQLLNDLWDTAATGHVEQDESMRQAVIREAREELGIEVDVADLRFSALGHVLIRPGYSYYNGYFEALRYEGEPEIKEPEKCDALEWFNLDDLPEDMIPERRQALLKPQDRPFYQEVGFEAGTE